MSKNLFSIILLLAVISIMISNISSTAAKVKKKMKLTITSSTFKNGEFIPSRYTCDGLNISPPLKFTGIPGQTKSIALIADDPDAPMGTWVHWVLFNLPKNTTQLMEDVPKDKTLDNGAKQGVNSGNNIGYAGPCPPSGTHRYFFKVYALDTVISLDSGITKAQLLSAIEGHIIADGQLMGKYARKSN
jgi:Raf kinase inhibitor-like YbhB/YbcL family protein